MDYPCIFNDVIYLELLLCAILYLLRKIQKEIIQIIVSFLICNIHLPKCQKIFVKKDVH